MSNKFQHRNLPMLLLQSRESVMRYFRKSLKLQGLTEQQWRVIRVLNEFGELETGKIAEETCIIAPSLSGVLERMERDDLIVRHRLSSDQRKVFVDLTPRSRELVSNISRSIDVQYEELERELGQERLLSIYSLLDQLIALPDPAETKVVRTRMAVKPAQKTIADKARPKK
ncbi:homoprotocatechuate degradation operon regulator HpaR [Herbaspirillum sp. RTI4]|uniref:homoprotocatechuate degradation operon regulator HpaR n=1 Tax=Herbaspirillum sp. RTI4 TaxID=3048640 RepID=UPI002AB53364|nr:homoprotocatechuate degradation operon regulator HpaR [Herbaspirillum sp. RTI4]MDY7579275.1 homoprotocatechuate degradation operon regulator HpaR [Herbaspirillum sp. RTI4]MEA9982774.1 homoprotocatechuate degradation operon regulator HpaR [Herbaspirillum sp. RTI4]